MKYKDNKQKDLLDHRRMNVSVIPAKTIFPQIKSSIIDVASGQMEDLFRLRFDVYCSEYEFLRPKTILPGMETDQFDRCAIHFAAYGDEHEIAGAVRLVQPDNEPYPFEYHCQIFSDAYIPPQIEAAEISRLVVKKKYRRRRSDSLYGMPGYEALVLRNVGQSDGQIIERRNCESPMILLSLYREMYRHSRRVGIKYWYAAMERSLAHSLTKMGFRFMPIGPQVDYYGMVTPHIVELADLERELRINNRVLYDWFQEAV